MSTIRFSGKKLPIKNKILLIGVSLGMIALLVLSWDQLNRALFPEAMAESIHHYYLPVLGQSPPPWFFGQAEIDTYLAAKNARQHTALDFVFMVFYGGLFLVVFRTLLLGLPQHLMVSGRWCLLLFGLPLGLGMFADLMENLLLLFVGSSEGGELHLAKFITCFTFAKTCLIGVVAGSLFGLCCMVFACGKKDARISIQPRPER